MGLTEKNLESLPEGEDLAHPYLGCTAKYGFLEADGETPIFTVNAACYAKLYTYLYDHCKDKEEVWVNYRLTVGNRNNQKIKFLRNVYEVFKASFPDAIISYGTDASAGKAEGSMLVYAPDAKTKMYINYAVKINSETDALELFLLSTVIRFMKDFQNLVQKDSYLIKECLADFGKARGNIRLEHSPFVHLPRIEKKKKDTKESVWVRGAPTTTTKTLHYIAEEMGYNPDSPRLYRMWGILLVKAIKEQKVRNGQKALERNAPCVGLNLQENLDNILFEIAKEHVAKQKELKELRKRAKVEEEIPVNEQAVA